MKLKLFIILAAALTAVLLGSAVAWRQRHSGSALTSRKSAAPDSALGSSARLFQVSGKVRKLDLTASTVTIAHEAIPGYMPAMTMPLTVRNVALLAGLQAGDEVHFELSVTEEDAWISNLEKIDGRGDGGSPNPGVSSAAEPEGLRRGETVPEFSLIDETGKSVRLSDFRGKAVVLTFIYTRCPLPNFCPLMSKNFKVLEKRLAKTIPGKYHLLSASIDPKFDTPEVLKRYAELYEANETVWSFGTGTEEAIEQLTSTFGLVRESEGGLISHNLRTALIGPDGRLIHLWKSNTWTPYEVQRMLEESGAMASAPKSGTNG